jgi:molecular chaperone DnaK
MGNTIDFGVDLGTTNSLIAKWTKGSVEVFKNPLGFKDTLPSIVGFRKDRILVGDQAKAFAEKDPKNVFSRFKRKMGTTECFKAKALEQSQTPVDLSALVLKELKSFVYTGEQVDAAVVTIPAAFDTVQSNATKEAGHKAGLKQVVLLQEPIAASLAYANKQKDRDLRNSQWLVYDLGGGTFDVALVRIADGELKVLDHEGDNYLGGSDFDAKIVKSVVVPRMQQTGHFEELETELTSASGTYNALWYRLLHLAEEARILLSSKTSAEIEFEVEDDAGVEHDIAVALTRSELEALITPEIDRTAEMIRTILTRKSLRSDDIQFVLMVGGVTFTPFVRKRIGELLGVAVNCEVDPVTAVVVGAAQFAATREKRLESETAPAPGPTAIKIRVSYSRTSQDEEELFAAKIAGDTSGLVYRITRDDGGFDTGLRPLSARITEDLPLQKDAYNSFSLQVLDAKGNALPTNVKPIRIAHGKYSVAGQPVPHDICLVLDDLSQDATKLMPLFQKNAVLPATTTQTVTANRTVVKGSAEQQIKIILVEGPRDAIPEANLTIGHLSISGLQIARDVPKGSDIQLTIAMSESRDLTVSAYVEATGQEFMEVFVPEQREVNIDTLGDQIRLLCEKLEAEIAQATQTESFEVAQELSKLRGAAEALDHEAAILSADDVTDDRYKLEDKKCRLAQDIASATKGKKLDQLRREYAESKQLCNDAIKENGNDQERHRHNQVVGQEEIFLSSQSTTKLREQIDTLDKIRWGVIRRTPRFLMEWFDYLMTQQHRCNDQVLAKSLIDAGKAAVASKNTERLCEVNLGLHNLLPQEEQRQAGRRFTGIC